MVAVNLSDAIARFFYGEGEWSLRLSLAGEPVTAPAAFRWDVDGPDVTASVEVIPDRYVRFDGLVLYRDGVPVDHRRQFTEPAALPPGIVSLHDLHDTTTSADG